MLSHDYKGIDKDFQTGKHLDTFGSINEMIEKCEDALMDVTRREKIAKAWQELASKEFSYQNIVKQIIELSE